MCVFCKLTRSRWIYYCVGMLTLGYVRIYEIICNAITFHALIIVIYHLHAKVINTVTLVMLCRVVYQLANCSPQDPIPQSSTAQRT